MASNDFLAFANGGSANVVSQSAYAALTSLLQNGFSSGVAQSNQLNKVWRQSSIMSAVVAQFIVNQTGQNATDDGTTATLLSNLTTAIGVAARQNPVLADTGTANNYVVANLSAFAAYPTVSGLTIDVSILNANTGASTINVDGLGTKPILGLGLQPLQGGELIVKGVACLLYIVASTVNSGNGAWVLMECAGGAQQVAPAIATQHAVQFGQVSGVVGQVRNLAMTVTTASASATLTADEIIVETGYGGLRYCLPNFSKTINLTATGVGGMDYAGTAPVSGFVAIYAIYNPTTQTSGLLGVNASGTLQANIYNNGAMPAGYIASALVAVWPTNASSQLVPGVQVDRLFAFGGGLAVNSATTGTLTSVNTFVIPKNAKTFSGFLQVGSSAACAISLAVYPMNANVAGQNNTCNISAGSSQAVPFNRIPVVTPQTFYYTATASAGTPGFTVSINAYEI